MGDITRHFSVSEFAVSQSFPDLAKEIQFSDQDKLKLFYLCAIILEPLRAILNETYGQITIQITSGKRSESLQDALKEAGYDPSPTSDHLFQNESVCCDFRPLKNNAKDSKITLLAYEWIRDNLTHAYSQLILYPKLGHIHVALPTKKNKGTKFWIQH